MTARAAAASLVDGSGPAGLARDGRASPRAFGQPMSLMANFRWMFAGNVVNAACQWGMLAVLAQLGDAAAVGHFILGLSVAAPVLALTMLQLQSVFVTDARGQFAFGDYFGNRLVWTAVAFLLILILAVPAVPDAAAAATVILVGVAKCIESLSDIVRALFQRRERMYLCGISLMLRGVAALAVLAVVVQLTGSVPIGTAAVALAWLLCFLLYDIAQAARLHRTHPDQQDGSLRPRFHWPTFGRLTLLALPLGVVMALISLQVNIPRYFLQWFAGSASLGYFGVLVYPMMAGMMVTTAMGQAASPRLARHYIADRAAFLRVLVRMSLLSALLGGSLIAAVWFAGSTFLGLCYGPSYAAYHAEFLVVAVAWGIQLVSSCWGYGLTAARYFRSQVALTIISCVVTAAASLYFIPDYGVMGASWAVLSTSLAMALGYAGMMIVALQKPPVSLSDTNTALDRGRP